jgi:hypothetical protein
LLYSLQDNLAILAPCPSKWQLCPPITVKTQNSLGSSVPTNDTLEQGPWFKCGMNQKVGKDWGSVLSLSP